MRLRSKRGDPEPPLRAGMSPSVAMIRGIKNGYFREFTASPAGGELPTTSRWLD